MTIVKPIVEVVAQTGSTNTDLLERDSLGSKPVLRLAWQQTQGRGTRQKQWVSSANDSLTFSLGWQANLSSAAISGWSVIVGVVLCNGLANVAGCRPIGIKWPNDLAYFSEGQLHKVGGILVESRVQADQVRLVTGVGLNLYCPTSTPIMNHQADSLPVAALCDQVVAWQTNQASKLLLVERIATDLCLAWQQFQAQGLSAFTDPFKQFDLLRSRSVQWLDSNTQHKLTGRCQGINAQGHLLVELANGTIQSLDSASAQVRLYSNAHP